LKAIDVAFFEREKNEVDNDFSSLSSVSPLDIGFSGKFRFIIQREESII
jgi:hypothetical protein